MTDVSQSGQCNDLTNLVIGNGNEIALFFQPDTADTIISSNLPAWTLDWALFATGSFAVLRSGGTLGMNVWFSDVEAGETFATWSERITRILEDAGFSSVSVEQIGGPAGTMVWGTKP